MTGGVDRPGVMEVPFGIPLADVLAGASALPGAGVLVGGYFGTWLPPESAAGALLTRKSLGVLGAGLGCGAVVVLPRGICPLPEVARVSHWLAGQSAGQCGPCANGLPAIAGALDELVDGSDADRAGRDVERWTEMVRGRGACKLPDGAINFVRSAVAVFADHIEVHRHRGPCPREHVRPVLPTPAWEALR